MQITAQKNSASLVLSLSASALLTITGTWLNKSALVVTGISSGTVIAILKLKKVAQTQEDLEKQLLEIEAIKVSLTNVVIQARDNWAKEVRDLKAITMTIKTELEKTQKTQKQQQQRIQTQDSRQRLHVQAIQKLQHQQKIISVRITQLDQKAIATAKEIEAVSRQHSCLAPEVSNQPKSHLAPIKRSPLTRVYIDGGNLFKSSQELGIKIDFQAWQSVLSEDAVRIKFKYYIGVSSQSHKQTFISYLEQLKYEVLQFPLLIRDNGTLKIVGDDVQMALDMRNEVKSGDRVILVTGDGDLIPAVKEVQRLGVPVTIVAKSDNLNRQLGDIADGIILLDDIQDKIAHYQKISVV